jgi:hypothetical protein
LTGEAGVSQTRIAYVVKGARSSELHVVDVDGFGARQLTAFKSPLVSPAWSANFGDLFFASCAAPPGTSTRFRRMAGTARQVSRGGHAQHRASVGPDGALAYVSNKDGNSEIYVSNADGSGGRRLTINRSIDTSPSWSPTGQRIAFTSDRGGSAQVYVMDRDGGNQRRLISGFSYSDSPQWSPKGDKICFVVRTGGKFDVYVANADGSNPRALQTEGSNENPHWSPDGRLIVFSSNRAGGKALYITDLRGTIVRRIDVPGAAANPAWSPRPAGRHAERCECKRPPNQGEVTMKLFVRCAAFCLPLVLVAVLAGCSKKKEVAEPRRLRPPTPTAETPPPAPPPTTTEPEQPTKTVQDQLADVFFGLRLGRAQLVRAVDARLRRQGPQRQASTSVTIEGPLRRARHGRVQPRRSATARRRLPRTTSVRFGIAASACRSSSYGEERPFASGADESAVRAEPACHFVVR